MNTDHAPLKHLMPGWFAIVMGWSGLALAWHRATPYRPFVPAQRNRGREATALKTARRHTAKRGSLWSKRSVTQAP